jgi:hypothetical protein
MGGKMSKSKKVIVWSKEGRLEVMDNSAFDGLKFIDRARDKRDEAPGQAKYLHFESPYFYSTDGHRLHNFIMDEDLIFTNGHYELIKLSASEIHLGLVDWQPEKRWDWQDLCWPTGLYEEINGSFTLTGSELSASYTKLVRHLPSDTALNFEYFKNLSLMESCDAGIYYGFMIFKAGKLGAAIAMMKDKDSRNG